MISPCTKQCQLDENSSYCKGCKRSIKEIMNWSRFTEQEQKNIMTMLKHRNIYKEVYTNNDSIRY